MSAIGKNLLGFLYRKPGVQAQHVRHKFVDWKMRKDFLHRESIKEHGAVRVRLNAIRKNKILPPELQALADKEVAALPRHSNQNAVIYRCVITSRSLGYVKPYRVSRICFRHLADYNFLAGWQRAMW